MKDSTIIALIGVASLAIGYLWWKRNKEPKTSIVGGSTHCHQDYPNGELRISMYQSGSCPVCKNA